MPHTKFTSLESFAHVYRAQRRFLSPDFDIRPAKVKYGAKVKLHGTNAGIRIEDGVVVAQGRNRDLSVTQDQYGFANWVSKSVDAWVSYASDFHETMCRLTGEDLGSTVVVHGEWAGRGIQNKDAVTKLNDKFFFVFAVEVGDIMVVASDLIESYIPDLDRLLVLPWHILCDDELDYADSILCDAFAQWANERAEEIGAEDPFIKEVFGIEGRGEGLVFVEALAWVPRDRYGYTTFKAKTADHGVKQGPAVTRDLVIPEGVPEFVTMFATVPRFEQGLEACGGKALPEKTGDFLKWVGQDVKKESVEELADAGLEWKDVSKHVTNAARAWWKDKTMEIN